MQGTKSRQGYGKGKDPKREWKKGRSKMDYNNQYV
jgi:hypothetical protein